MQQLLIFLNLKKQTNKEIVWNLKLLKQKRLSEYQNRLAGVEQIFQAKAGTKESGEADVMAILIKQYGDEHYLTQHLIHCSYSIEN